jgi:selenocysteine lyase/cysteine desulfurase
MLPNFRALPVAGRRGKSLHMLANQRHLFDIPADIAWFNTAYMSAQLNAATAAGLAGMARKAQPWRIPVADFFSETETARTLFATLVGGSAEEVALIPSAGYGLGLAARTLPVARGQTILLLAEEFPSNVYPWHARAAEAGARIETVPAPADGDWTAAVLARLRSGVAVAALPHCHWADGGLLDLVAIGAACRSIGAALALDLTQSAGALPIDVGAVQPDFLVAASYKWLMGPYSLGFAWIHPRWHEAEPLEQGWASRANARDFTRLVAYTDAWQPGARRFDVGERSNFVLLPVAIAALEQLLAWTPTAIAGTLDALNTRLCDRLLPLGLQAGASRSPHLLGLRLPAHAPEGIAGALAARQIHISQRGAHLRIAPHLHVTDADCDRLVGALEQLLA